MMLNAGDGQRDVYTRVKLNLRLNMTTRPITNKYREGKQKRTLKREFNGT